VGEYWYQTEPEGEACLRLRDQGWEHQVEEYRNGVPCQSLHSRV